MKILKMEIGAYASNCYIIYDERSKEGIVVDPGGNPSQILENIEKNEISVKYIVLTHGHGDHIGGVRELKEALNLPLIAHEAEAELIGDASQNISHMMVTGAIELETDITVKDGDTIDFGNLSARIIHTPGHTKGGMCLHIGDYLISGDTLFKESIGRSDLPGGDHGILIKSIKDKLLVLAEDTIVLPGHGDPTSIRHEKMFNTFL